MAHMGEMCVIRDLGPDSMNRFTVSPRSSNLSLAAAPASSPAPLGGTPAHGFHWGNPCIYRAPAGEVCNWQSIRFCPARSRMLIVRECDRQSHGGGSSILTPGVPISTNATPASIRTPASPPINQFVFMFPALLLRIKTPSEIRRMEIGRVAQGFCDERHEPLETARIPKIAATGQDRTHPITERV